MAQALRYDGIVAEVEDPAGVADLADDAAARTPAAAATRPFEIVAQGQTPPDPDRRGGDRQPRSQRPSRVRWIDADWDGSTVEVDAPPHPGQDRRASAGRHERQRRK